MLYSIPLLLQSDKDHSQLKTQLPNAGEGVDTDVLTGSKSDPGNDWLIIIIIFSLGRTENRNYLGACRNNPSRVHVQHQKLLHSLPSKKHKSLQLYRG